MGSFSREILSQVGTLQKPGEVWRAINEMFATQSQAQAINTRIELTNLKLKSNMAMAEYLGKIKSLTDEVACTAVALSDPEIVRLQDPCWPRHGLQSSRLCPCSMGGTPHGSKAA